MSFKMTEKKLEKRCADIAKANGWYTRKWSSPSSRGVPDRIFIRDGDVKFIEFKAFGKKPTKLQTYEMHMINKKGGDVHWCDSVESFKLAMGIRT